MKLVVDGIIFQKDPHGGIVRTFVELLPRLCDLAPDLEIILFTDGPVRGKLPEHARIVHRRLPGVRPTLRPRGLARRILFPLRRVLGDAWNRARLGWLSDARTGIWHSTFYTLPDAWVGPQVVTVHDLIPERFPQYYADPLDEIGRQRKRACMQRADRIVCDTHATRRLVEALHPELEARVRTVHLACSNIFRPLDSEEMELPEDLARPYLLYVGSRFGYKNFELLLQVFAGWSLRHPVDLVCVGAAWQAGEQRRLDDLGVRNRVRLLEHVDDRRLCSLYHRAAGFVYPSLEEGFGVPVLEAMACGCPVVASQIPTTQEIAADIPIYFAPERPAELEAALERLLNEDHTRRRQAGLERVRLFSWEKTARQVLEIYRELDAEAAGGGWR